MRENKRCNLGILTHITSLFILTLPHLAVAAAFSAVAFILMTDLNQSGVSATSITAAGSIHRQKALYTLLYLYQKEVESLKFLCMLSPEENWIPFFQQ